MTTKKEEAAAAEHEQERSAVYKMALALAKANKHTDPEGYATEVVRAHSDLGEKDAG
jgi:hypothetical protein